MWPSLPCEAAVEQRQLGRFTAPVRQRLTTAALTGRFMALCANTPTKHFPLSAAQLQL